MTAQQACPRCLARAWLLARLSGHLDQVRDRTDLLLELGDDELIRAVAGRHAAEVSAQLAAFHARRGARQLRREPPLRVLANLGELARPGSETEAVRGNRV